MSRSVELQDSIVRLLEDSPLPWVHEMLCEWFDLKGGDASLHNRSTGIRRLGRGMYTAESKIRGPLKLPRREPIRSLPKKYYPHRIITVTDEMVTRYTGIKL